MQEVVGMYELHSRKKMKSRKSFLACKFRRATSSQKAVASNGLRPRMP